jgi:hypothetical protein
MLFDLCSEIADQIIGRKRNLLISQTWHRVETVGLAYQIQNMREELYCLNEGASDTTSYGNGAVFEVNRSERDDATLLEAAYACTCTRNWKTIG